MSSMAWEVAPSDTAAARGGELPPLTWLGLPALMLVVLLGCAWSAPDLYARLFRGELGVVELATPAAVLVGIGFAIAAMRRAPGRAARAWLVAFVIGGVYFAGEELSWGQHLVGWETPAAYAAFNDQVETNLHNTSSWLDQKPKWALRAGALLGGILAPLAFALWRREGRWRFLVWIWPTWACTPVAALVIATAVLGRLDPGALPGDLGQVLRLSELEELWIALFLMLYAASLRARLPRIAVAPASRDTVRR